MGTSATSGKGEVLCLLDPTLLDPTLLDPTLLVPTLLDPTSTSTDRSLPAPTALPEPSAPGAEARPPGAAPARSPGKHRACARSSAA